MKNGAAYRRGIRIAVTLSPQAARQLVDMAASGLWGRTRAEVAQRLIYGGLRDYEVEAGAAERTRKGRR